MIITLLGTGQSVLWIVVLPLLAIVVVAAVAATASFLWIWRGGRGERLTTPDSADEENGAVRHAEFLTGYASAPPAWPRYVPFLVLVAVALLVGTCLYSLGFMQGVWSH